MMSSWLRFVGEVHDAPKRPDNSVDHDGKDHTENKNGNQNTDRDGEHGGLLFLAEEPLTNIVPRTEDYASISAGIFQLFIAFRHPTWRRRNIMQYFSHASAVRRC
jgi:hypothetical protein